MYDIIKIYSAYAFRTGINIHARRKSMKRVIGIIAAAAAAMSMLPMPGALAAAEDSILTDNIVEINESVSDEGFIHPGVGASAAGLETMRDMVKQGVSPWVDYFEGLRRTSYAAFDAPLKHQEVIENNGGITSFCQDVQTAWTHAVLYFVTGNEEYRRIPAEVIRWYGSRENFFPEYFGDSHIKIGKYVNTLCTAAEIMRCTEPSDESLKITEDDIDKLYNNCLVPIVNGARLNSNSYFMNQHSYAVQGYLAASVVGDNREDYNNAIEMTTVNASITNKPRNGAIDAVIRDVDENAETGEAVEPHLQLVEMGRDQDHAVGNITNLLIMARTADIQRTVVDEETGEPAESGISVTKFGGDKIVKGAQLWVQYNMGYSYDWTPVWAEYEGEKQVIYRELADEYRGRLMGNYIPMVYLSYKGMGYDMEKDYPYIAYVFEKLWEADKDRVLSGEYIETLHNYGFDFWLELGADAAISEPDEERAREALSTELKEYESDVDIIEFENRWIDLDALGADGLYYPSNDDDKSIEQLEEDGRGFMRVTVGEAPRSVVIYNADMPKNKLGVMVRSYGSVKINIHMGEDFEEYPTIQCIDVPDTGGEWRYITFDFSEEALSDSQRGSMWVLEIAGEGTVIDFDHINTNEAETVPVKIESKYDTETVALYKGLKMSRTYKADGDGVKYRALNLPDGAAIDENTGMLMWTPNTEGEYSIYVIADNGKSVYAKPVVLSVSEDYTGAVEVINRNYDPETKYVSSTLETYKAAAQVIEAQQSAGWAELSALQSAVDGLELLNPQLSDGTLDYTGICESTQGSKISIYADGIPSNSASWSEPDMNMVMDFGSGYRVRADKFGIQARTSFPARVWQMNVYGSNDRVNWTRLTSKDPEISEEMQIIDVYENERGNTYRYLMIYMPNGIWRQDNRAYIADISEFRIYGERIEVYTPDFNRPFMDGYDDGSFLPENNITRAEAVHMMSRLVPSAYDKSGVDNVFSDVPDDAWYADSVKYMQKKKYITVDESGLFNPEHIMTKVEMRNLIDKVLGTETEIETGTENDPVTRAEAAKMTVEALGSETSDNRGTLYTDVSPEHWAYEYIMEASCLHAI